jgi:hypothetical protein
VKTRGGLRELFYPLVDFFPDFVVGVTNRSTPDSIALIEIKDDGVTGRLQADSNVMKICVQHQEYKNVFWTYRADHGVGLELDMMMV